MRKFTAVAILAILAITVSTASAGVIGDMTDSGTSSSSGAIDLTANGGYYWAIWNDSGPEATDYKSGTSPITVAFSGSSGGWDEELHGGGKTPDNPGGKYENSNHAYANPMPVDLQVGSGYAKGYTNFNWTDGTNTTVASDFDADGIHVDEPYGWVANSQYRSQIREGYDGDNDGDLDWYALDEDYPDSFATFDSSSTYNAHYSTMILDIPVPEGDSTVFVYFNEKRTKTLVDAVLSVDSDVANSLRTTDYTSVSSDGLYTAEFEVTGATEAQNLTVTLKSQQVWKDTNRTMGVQAVSVVPEPATMSLLALGGLGVLIRRRRS